MPFKKNNAKQNFDKRKDIPNSKASKRFNRDERDDDKIDNSNKHANIDNHEEKNKQEGGWRKIPGYEHYEVSSDGKIRSRSHDTGNRVTTGKILSTRETDTGTEIVDLWTDGDRDTKVVGELVAKAWKGDKSGDKEAFHKDRSGNNSSKNIEWKSRSEINKEISEQKSVARTLIDEGLL